jgi:hypothetical protein
MVGIFAAVAAVFGVAGVAKLLRPAPAARAVADTGRPVLVLLGRAPVIRLVGLAEVVVAVGAIGWGGRGVAVLVALGWLGLAAVAWELAETTPGRDCGCFGSAPSPVTRWHVAVNLAAAGVAVAAVVRPPESWVAALGDAPFGQAVVLIVLTGLLAWLVVLLLTAWPTLLAAVRQARADDRAASPAAVRPAAVVGR